jgi:hypothetical protein
VLWLPAVASCAACCWGWAGLAHQGGRGARARGGCLAAWLPPPGGARVRRAWLGWGLGLGRPALLVRLCAWLLGKRQISVKAQHMQSKRYRTGPYPYQAERIMQVLVAAGGSSWVTPGSTDSHTAQYTYTWLQAGAPGCWAR